MSCLRKSLQNDDTGGEEIDEEEMCGTCVEPFDENDDCLLFNGLSEKALERLVEVGNDV